MWHNYRLVSQISNLSEFLVRLCTFVGFFFQTMFKMFKLEPTWFITFPAYCFSSFLYLTKVRLPYIQCQQLYETCEALVRGGLSFSAMKHALFRDWKVYSPFYHLIMYFDVGKCHALCKKIVTLFFSKKNSLFFSFPQHNPQKLPYTHEACSSVCLWEK